MTALNASQIELLRTKFEAHAREDAVREHGLVRDSARVDGGYRSTSMDFAWRAVQAMAAFVFDTLKPVVKLVSFDEFIEHGREHCIESGSTLTNGMPWSFMFEGHVVTHETDDLFLIGPDALQFKRGEVLIVVTCGDTTMLECYGLEVANPL